MKSKLRLRTRITALFAAGALVSCTSMGVLSFTLARHAQIATRERTAVRATYGDARTVFVALSADGDLNSDEIDTLLRNLGTSATRRALLFHGGRWYVRGDDAGLTNVIPPALRTMVNAGTPATQRIDVAQVPALVMGVPLPDGDEFYIVDSMGELDASLHSLAWILTAVAAGTIIAFAFVGIYAARRVTRPLATITKAARDIRAGDMNTRLVAPNEPDVRTLATAFNSMVDALAARMQQDRRFAADVSHELRSPLQTLAAAVGVLDRHRDQLDARTNRAMDLVTEEIGRFQTLVTDLLELASGDSTPDIEDVDIVVLARRACTLAGASPAIVVDEVGADRVWPLDRRRMERVLVNLLENAARYGGGATAVILQSAAGHRIIQVDDAGPGVAEEDRDRIFERFVRGSGSGARGSGVGTGLGLALVATYVRAHSGDVAVCDRPGGGARFTLILPGATP